MSGRQVGTGIHRRVELKCSVSPNPSTSFLGPCRHDLFEEGWGRGLSGPGPYGPFI